MANILGMGEYSHELCTDSQETAVADAEHEGNPQLLGFCGPATV